MVGIWNYSPYLSIKCNNEKSWKKNEKKNLGKSEKISTSEIESFELKTHNSSKKFMFLISFLFTSVKKKSVILMTFK